MSGIEFEQYCNENDLHSIKDPAKRAQIIAKYPGYGDDDRYMASYQESFNYSFIQQFLKEHADFDNFPSEYIKLACHLGTERGGEALNSLFLKKERYHREPDWGRLYDEIGYFGSVLKKGFQVWNSQIDIVSSLPNRRKHDKKSCWKWSHITGDWAEKYH